MMSQRTTLKIHRQHGPPGDYTGLPQKFHHRIVRKMMQEQGTKYKVEAPVRKWKSERVADHLFALPLFQMAGQSI